MKQAMKAVEKISVRVDKIESKKDLKKLSKKIAKVHGKLLLKISQPLLILLVGNGF